MTSKPVSGNVSATFAKLAEAYETLALIHSRASGKPLSAKKPVAKRDPNEPKKPPSVYTLFIHDKRLKIKRSQPNIAPTEAWAKTIEAWSNISDEERRQYEERVAAMKKEYAIELAKYKAEHGTPAAELEEDESEEEGDESVPAVTMPAPVAPPSQAPRAKKAKGGDAPAQMPEINNEDKAEEGATTVASATAPSKAPRVKKVKGGDDKEEPKAPAEPAVAAASDGPAPEKRKKSVSAGGEAEATTEDGGEHRDSEKKKKKKKSHKSKHSESQ
ncbi:High mobility group [Coemansia sp. BCRC 34301]|nr:High mobility group [Coemansia sp. BCRC 34301]